MKKHFLSLIAASIILGTSGCYYDVEEDLYPTNCVTENQSYATDIVPILQNNCYVCHAASIALGNVILEGHTNLKAYADNGKLVGVINHDSRFPAMPQGAAKLSDCNISKIEQWVTAGAPDN